MSEYSLIWIASLGFVLLNIGCVFYALGGRDGKWKRRFIGSLIVSSAVFLEFILLHKFNWWLLAIYPLTIGAFVLGYGADTLGLKVWKRSVVVLASLCSGLLLAFLVGSGQVWWLFGMECVIASMSIVFGVVNPIQASAEEFFICACLWMPKLFYAFV